MCVVNGENGVRGANYGESSPRFRSSSTWSDYVEPFGKCLLEFSMCCLVVYALVSWTTILRLDVLAIHGRVLFMHAISLLGFSPLKVFWTWSGHGRLPWTNGL